MISHYPATAQTGVFGLGRSENGRRMSQAMNDGVMIQAEKITKMYADFAALSDVSITVPRGQAAAFLWPNGAGKTTTMKVLTGFLAPTNGRARIAGFDVATHRLQAAERLGYLPENGPLYLDMTPMGLLRFFGEARGLQ